MIPAIAAGNRAQKSPLPWIPSQVEVLSEAATS